MAEPATCAETQTGSGLATDALHRAYDAACRVFYEACKRVEAAEDYREVARRRCMEHERGLGIG